jgi:DNA mismatch repair protein MSH4
MRLLSIQTSDSSFQLVVIPRQDSLYDSEQAINNVLRIKTFVQAIPVLYMALASARSILLTRVRDICRPEVTNDILALILETINEDVTYVDSPLDLRNQRTYAVKVEK